MSSYDPRYDYSNTRGSSSSSGELINGIALITLIFVVIFTCEVIYKSIYDSRNRFQTLLDYTASSDDMTITIHQNPNKYPDAKPIGLSMNERSGIEFAYSFYVYALPKTFDGHANFKHVFHKGYTFAWPLMGPGVFFKGDENTMRVVMNTYKNPYVYADIKNMPVQKWVHVVLNCVKGGLDIFVNGNLASRIPFTDTLPYQNFQDVVIFSTTNSNILGQANMPASIGSNPFPLAGSFSGYLSNLKYARYALSVNEIQALMNAGPSAKKADKVMDKPPYMADDWWAGQH
jgi:hypothetical protein